MMVHKPEELPWVITNRHL